MGSMSEKEYLEGRLDDQIDWYDRKSQWNQQWFKRLRILEIAAAASIPVWVSFDLNLVAGVVGGLVAVISGALALYKFDQLWVSYRSTSQALQQEKYFYGAGVGPYAEESERFGRLVTRVEAIAAQEYSSWQQVVNAEISESSWAPPPD